VHQGGERWGASAVQEASQGDQAGPLGGPVAFAPQQRDVGIEIAAIRGGGDHAPGQLGVARLAGVEPEE